MYIFKKAKKDILTNTKYQQSRIIEPVTYSKLLQQDFINKGIIILFA